MHSKPGLQFGRMWRVLPLLWNISTNGNLVSSFAVSFDTFPLTAGISSLLFPLFGIVTHHSSQWWSHRDSSLFESSCILAGGFGICSGTVLSDLVPIDITANRWESKESCPRHLKEIIWYLYHAVLEILFICWLSVPKQRENVLYTRLSCFSVVLRTSVLLDLYMGFCLLRSSLLFISIPGQRNPNALSRKCSNSKLTKSSSFWKRTLACFVQFILFQRVFEFLWQELENGR